jgi:hypothetical protein
VVLMAAPSCPEDMMSSEENSVTYTFPTGEWQWIASFLVSQVRHQIGQQSMEENIDTVTGGVTATWLKNGDAILFLSVTSPAKETYVIASVPSQQHRFAGFWKRILRECIGFEAAHRELLRNDINQRMDDLLYEYYRRRQQLEDPRLSDMAIEYGVDYGKLRKYKMRFDEEMRRIRDQP